MSKYTKVYIRILVILFIMLVFIIALPNDSGNADFALEYLPSTISIKLISQTDIEASDITYDQISKTVYTSVHSLAEKYASSVVPINVTTMQVGTPIFVDGEPYKLE
ncbi:MAG: hypothetical protein KC434_05610, partial [Anaerolineales bacterium]|nr:hypothetical protein [Anaerolineales bacterium]